MTDPQWVLIGEIVKTQGNKGEIRVLPHTDFPERFFGMEQVHLFNKGEEEVSWSLNVSKARRHKNIIVLKLVGIDDLNEAGKLVGMEIKVKAQDVAGLPPGSHYVFQLIGLKVTTENGQRVGVIQDVLRTGANDVYIVKPDEGITRAKEILVPVIESVVKNIDLDNHEVIIDPPDGLWE